MQQVQAAFVNTVSLVLTHQDYKGLDRGFLLALLDCRHIPNMMHQRHRASSRLSIYLMTIWRGIGLVYLIQVHETV